MGKFQIFSLTVNQTQTAPVIVEAASNQVASPRKTIAAERRLAATVRIAVTIDSVGFTRFFPPENAPGIVAASIPPTACIRLPTPKACTTERFA